ncbi:Glycosylated lysosomal membrane protein, partial [Bienertia sinuspersici]
VHDKNSLFSTRTLILRSEIERTLRRIRKEQRKIHVDLEFNLEKLFEEESNMAARTLKELGVPKLGDEPLCITDTHLQNIDTQIGQICTSLSNLESQLLGKLPSQPHPNPKEQVNRVILREPEEANEFEELEVISEES